jgi:HSP20 family protein
MEERMNQWFNMGGKEVGVSEDDKNVYVEAHLPGIDQKDLTITLRNNTLLIKGEKKEEKEDKEKRHYRRARRSFMYQVDLPSPVDEEPAEATLEDGLLKLTFPKTAAKNVKKITVKSGMKNTSKKGSKTKGKL